ncbi:septum formation inhibitor Maf [Ideonella sp. TBM-1]|uniref:dTTP/UTP pyrophosphatase n=1 Tax=Ideonella livida TaxID=2707176 RepID=A0A7C9PEY5_9BURK|nr:Maf family protein [Ideonella livida]NDY90213.1 septum formation inhibitor Maf [Ideonella livida]
MPPVLYLASQSPRRLQLLAQLGLSPQTLLPGPQEDAEALEAERPGEPPEVYVRRVTLAKLEAACARRQCRGLPEAPVLCADTTVALGDRILGKPADAADALRTLRLLSGQTHEVFTAVALQAGGQARLALSRSSVDFAAVPEEVLHAYVASGEPFGKAGAYAIQSSLAGWIPTIRGSYSGIMGLPLYETTQLLRDAGVLP